MRNSFLYDGSRFCDSAGWTFVFFDLPLNTSHGTLQQDGILKVTRKNITKKWLDVFRETSDNFEKFCEAFSKNLKLGIHEATQNCSILAEFLRFYSAKAPDERISFKGGLSLSSSSFNRSPHFAI